MPAPHKGSHRLRTHRVSLPSSTYLLTFCTHERKPTLATQPIFTAILDELTAMEADFIWQSQALMVMPDHVHLIVRLGDILDLSRAISRLKTRTRSALHLHALRWQIGYHDHRLRPDDARLPICYYVFMNPVRAGFTSTGTEWPYQWWRPEVWSWFKPYAREAHSVPAWTSTLP